MNKILTTCTICRHGKWKGDVCKYCYPPPEVVMDIPQKKRKLNRKKKVKKKVKKKIKKNLNINTFPCYACNKPTTNSCKTCSPLCTVMMTYAIYTNKGIIFKKTRDEVLADIISKKRKI